MSEDNKKFVLPEGYKMISLPMNEEMFLDLANLHVINEMGLERGVFVKNLSHYAVQLLVTAGIKGGLSDGVLKKAREEEAAQEAQETQKPATEETPQASEFSLFDMMKERL